MNCSKFFIIYILLINLVPRPNWDIFIIAKFNQQIWFLVLVLVILNKYRIQSILFYIEVRYVKIKIEVKVVIFLNSSGLMTLGVT